MADRILVLGGTGLLGGAAARALAAVGWEVRVMTRRGDHARGPIGYEVESVAGDVSDREALRRAMIGCYGVHISIGGSVDFASAQNVCSLARETGIGRVTYISGATVCEQNRWFPMVAQKLEAERAIVDSGLPYTIFRPTLPMEMLARFARGGKPVMMGTQPYPLHWYAVDELGRMVMNAYRVSTADGKCLYVHGPEGIPMKAALQRYCDRILPDCKKVSVMPIPMAKLMGALTRKPELKFAARLMEYFDRVGEMGDPAEANALLGAPRIRLEEWLDAHAKEAHR